MELSGKSEIFWRRKEIEIECVWAHLRKGAPYLPFLSIFSLTSPSFLVSSLQSLCLFIFLWSWLHSHPFFWNEKKDFNPLSLPSISTSFSLGILVFFSTFEMRKGKLREVWERRKERVGERKAYDNNNNIFCDRPHSQFGL